MAERLKDMFFTEESVNALANAVKQAHARFDKEAFIQLVFDEAFTGLELKQMMRHTTECLHQLLPKSYGRAVLQFSFVLKVSTKKTCRIRIEYVVYFAKARGKVGKKVFRITENSFAPGEHQFTRKHSFADMSTRKHHPGEHQIAIVVNGREKSEVSFRLFRP